MTQQEYLTSLASGQGENFNNFCTKFNERLAAVNGLDASIRSQWTSPLSMAYHWWKHEKDFGSQPVSIEKYFNELSNSLFQEKNITYSTFTQGGTIKHTYATCFGSRIHVGFTVGQNEIIASHFGKDKPR